MKKVALGTVVVLLLLAVLAGCGNGKEADTTAPAISAVADSGITSSGVTITWTTDEPATSQVEYGQTTSYGSTTTLNTNLVTSHSISLSGLSAGTPYHYRVKSKDASDNEAVSGDYTFTTAAPPDTTPPVISAVAASSITTSAATITWTTDEPATSQVEYGLTTSYGSTTTLDTDLATSHSVNLSGLTAATPYHYRVKSKDASGNEAASGDYTFTTSPLAILSGQPTGSVNYNTADIAVADTNVVAYKYKLDAGTWSAETPVSTHITLSALADGLHTVSVIGKDGTGNWQSQASPTTASWTVDTTPPTSALSGQPTGTVNYNTADITVSGTDVVAYKYMLDAGTWGAETSASTHITLSSLAEGLHTVSVIGKDTAGNWQSEASPTTASWMVDTTPPTSALSGQPTGTVNYNTADITVAGTDVVAYKYKLDAGTWSAETSVSTHITLSALADGLHTVSVIGKDTAGNWQSQASPTTASWMVDTTPPTAILSGQPSGSVNYNTADITVAGTDVVAYKYMLDAGTWSAETPVSTHITLSALADGLHTVSVIGKDGTGNWQSQASPTIASWTVDTTPPTAALSGQPSGTVNYNTADITVGSTDVVAYKYMLDAGTWSVETSVSTHITLSALAEGLHTVSVIGKDAAGNWQPQASPTTASWTVDTTPPTATLSGQPTGTVNYDTADITVAGTDVVAYKYKLDAGTWSVEISTSTHITLSALAEGLHTVSVIGKDAAGNWQSQASPTIASWTVDTTPPVISAVADSGITSSGATITWTTDEAATSQVEYGLTTSYGSTTTLDTNLVTSHSVDLSGLSAGTPYHYRVRSKDASQNEAVSDDFTFTTEGEQWAAYAFDQTVTPQSGSPGTIQSFTVLENYSDGGSTWQFEITGTYLGIENTEIKTTRIEMNLNPPYDYTETTVSTFMDCYKVKHHVTVLQAPPGEVYPEWADITVWIPTAGFATGQYFWIYPKAEYADSDGNSAEWSYYLTQAMQDEVNNPPSGESILYVPYAEGDFYGYDSFILYGLYGWGWSWFDAYAVGGQQYLEEGSWSESYGGVTYTYSCTAVVESIGAYSFHAWELDISWTDGTDTFEYRGIFSPDLPVPIYLKVGAGTSYWEYELTDLTLG